MATEKTRRESPAENAFTFGPAMLTSGIEMWKAQPTALASYCSEMLSGAEAQMRRQADFLGQLSRCKDVPEALSLQASFAQAFWTESIRQMQKSLLTARQAFVPSTES
ncbi:MAG: hypothetical protein DI527_12735 [Chelatococcus sp.]|nr:MAG: hypothetical protein DI527_12735 [Chelatococcus sp.]